MRKTRVSEYFLQSKAILSALGVILSVLVLPAPVEAEAQTVNRHAGYYYPHPQTQERYRARVPIVQEADRRTRVAFTTGLTTQMLGAPSAPRFAIFAKGDRAEKLIIVGLTDDAFNTIYRLRALLAMLTAYSRSTPAFQGHPYPENLTFLDLIYLIGFEEVTVSNGRDVAHRIELEDPAQN